VKYKAVVFDLFGTLVDADGDRWDQLFKDMSNAWGVPLEEFKQPWIASGVERDMGGFQRIEEQLTYVCDVLELAPPNELLSQAKADYAEMRRQSLQPRSGVIETLQELQFVGLLRGLVSNCSFVDSNLWPGCEIAPHIDVPVLSAEVHLMKPDRRIFQLACTRLDVQPEDCLYVGDGGSHELTAAKALGMHPVLIRTPYDNGSLGKDMREGEHWTGPRISSIPEVMGLLE